MTTSVGCTNVGRDETVEPCANSIDVASTQDLNTSTAKSLTAIAPALMPPSREVSLAHSDVGDSDLGSAEESSDHEWIEPRNLLDCIVAPGILKPSEHSHGTNTHHSDKNFGKNRKNEQEERLCSLLLNEQLRKSDKTVFFDRKGHRVISESFETACQQYLTAKYDGHMPHFSAIVTNNSVIGPSQSIKVLEAQETDQDEHDLNAALTSSKQQQIRLRQQIVKTTAPQSSRIVIHHAAFFNLVVIDVSKKDLSTADRARLANMADPFTKYVADRAISTDTTIVAIIHFNPRLVGKFRVRIGVPIWAEGFAETVKSGSLVAVIHGTDESVQQLKNMRDLLTIYNQTRSPLMQWFVPECTRPTYSSKWICVEGVKTQEFKYQGQIVFNNVDEYLTVQAVTAVCNRKVEVASKSCFEDVVFRLRLMRIAGAGDRVYMGWFSLPDDKHPRPRAGDKLKIILKSQWRIFPPTQKTWSATVSETNSGPQEMVAIVLSRPWYQAKKSYSQETLHTVETEDLTEEILSNAIRADAGNEVCIEYTPHCKIMTAQLNAIQDIANPAKGRPSLTEWNQHILTALVGSGIHTLPAKDIYEDVRAEYVDGDVTAVMNLNEGQREAILGMSSVLGGLALVQGASGTGKSKLCLEAIKPSLRSRKPSQILIVSSSNQAADQAAAKVQLVLDDLRAHGSNDNKGYMVRAYTPNAEKAIRDIDSRFKGKRDTSRDRPSDIEGDTEWDLLDFATKIITRCYADETKPVHEGKFASLDDKRVQQPNLSVAMKMLEVAGVYQGRDTYADDSPFAQLRAKIRRHRAGEMEHEDEFRSLIQHAMDFTLQKAKVIVTTTKFATISGILPMIEETCRLVVADDFNQEKELSYLPLLFTRFNLVGLLCAGDCLSLRPIVTTTPEQNVYYKQESISFMQRLIDMGFPHFQLSEQHRMNEELCAMANLLTYNNSLTTHESATISKRMFSGLFRNWARTQVKQRTSKMVINVHQSHANSTFIGRKSSRYNDLFVIVVINTAAELLALNARARVVMLAPYAAQRDRLKIAALNLKMKDPDLFETAPDRLSALTVDAAQGLEFDYVVDQILPNDQGLGFQRDAHRGNVAITRAKHGYVLITDVHMAKQAAKSSKDFPSRLLDHLKPYRKHIHAHEIRACEYYIPSQAESRVSDERHWETRQLGD